MSRPKRDQLIRLVSEPALKAEWTAFCVDCQARQLSPKTLRFYRTELGLWCNWLTAQGITTLKDISPDVLRRWFVHLQQMRNAGGVHASYRAIKAFLRWAWAEYELDLPNPIAKVQVPKAPLELLEPVPMSSVKAMLQTCSKD
ncbi:MAG: site-specific integrase, partial [Anaerolineae bacterium]